MKLDDFQFAAIKIKSVNLLIKIPDNANRLQNVSLYLPVRGNIC